MDPVVSNIFDNETTMSYKWSFFYQVPVKYLRKISDWEYEPYSQAMERFFQEGTEWSDIYTFLFAGKDLQLQDIAMIYYQSLLEEKVELTEPTILQAVNRVYYLIDLETSYDRLSDLPSLQYDYREWRKAYDLLLEENVHRYEQILDIQDRLSFLSEKRTTQASSLRLKTTISSFFPTINGIPVKKENALDIFNSCLVSAQIPYLLYRDGNGKAYIRLYTSEHQEDAPNYEATIINDRETSDPDTLYLTICLGDSEGKSYSELPRESFFRVIYHLENNYLTIESPAVKIAGKEVEENFAISLVRNGLFMLDLGEASIVKISGDFEIWNFSWQESTFLDSLLLDFVINGYLYIDESIEVQALKKRLDINFRPLFTDEKEYYTPAGVGYLRNSATISVTMSNRQTVEEDVVQMLDLNDLSYRTTSEVTIPAHTPYFHITVKHAVSQEELHSFINIFTLLLDQYLSEEDNISSAYNYYLPQLQQLPILLQNVPESELGESEEGIFKVNSNRTKGRRSGVKLIDLQKQAASVFVGGWARRCQPPFQPMVVDENWQGPVLPFLVDGKIVNFGCPRKGAPYPVLVANDLDNKDKYPYTPCCRARPQTGKNSIYSRYLANLPPEQKIGAKAGKKINTDKILRPKGIGFLPLNVENILSTYSVDHGEICRYGVDYSPASFLHCVCVATQDSAYLSLKTREEREDYVNFLRSKIASSVDPSLLSQELYDYRREQILDLLQDVSVPFDPFLFYRAIEEVFQLSVYIFSPSEKNNDHLEDGAMVIPRFRKFHVHTPHPTRPVLIIFRTLSSKSNVLPHPQCELIIDQRKKESIFLFTSGMQQVCQHTLTETIENITWKPTSSQFKAYNNLYSRVNFLSLLSAATPIAQTLDRDGKLRLLHWKYQEKFFSLVVVPSSPENLPLTDDVYPGTSSLLQELLGDPSYRTVDENGRTNGHWYQLFDLPEGVYAPLIPFLEETSLPVSDNNPCHPSSFSENYTSRVRRLQRTFRLIISVVRWMYLLYVFSKKYDPLHFQRTYFIINESPVDDSSTFYDLRGLSRKLPEVINMERGLRELEQQVPTLVHRQKLVLYNQRFAKGIFKMVDDYHNLHYGLATRLRPPSFLENFYLSSEDFEHQEGTQIFLSFTDLQKWRQSLVRNYDIHSTVTVEMSLDPEPYLYAFADGRVYLLQNVQGRSKRKALTVAQEWREKRINPGYDVADISDIPPHLVYGISGGQVFELFENYSDKTPEPLEVVYYGSLEDRKKRNEPRYAAALRLL